MLLSWSFALVFRRPKQPTGLIGAMIWSGPKVLKGTYCIVHSLPLGAMYRFRFRLGLTIILSLIGIAVIAQNPFDLKSRLNGDTTVVAPILPDTSGETTPRVVAPTPPIQVPTPTVPKIDSTPLQPQESLELQNPAEEEPSEPAPLLSEGKKWFSTILTRLNFFSGRLQLNLDQNVLFGFTLIILLMLACLMVIQRSMLYNAYRAVSNDNYLRFLLREYQNRPLIYRLYYAYFFVNLGLFAFLALFRMSASIDGNVLLMPFFVAVFIVIYLIRHLVLSTLGSTFPVSKETDLFGFIIMLINIVLGIVLTPINIALCFGPPSSYKALIFLGLALFVFLYLFRQLKGIFISGRILSGYLFHFFLYFCIVEIAPLLVIGKLATTYLGVR